MSEFDQLRAAAAEDVNLRNAMQELPPSVGTSTMPEMESYGLEDLRVHMSENGYNTFLSVMHWAVLCQEMSDGQDIDWDDGKFAAMSAPFTGFGNPHQWQTVYSDRLGIIIHAHYLNWHAEGKRFRRENPLPHKILKEVAPLFANTSRGWQHAQMLRDLVNDPRLLAKL